VLLFFYTPARLFCELCKYLLVTCCFSFFIDLFKSELWVRRKFLLLALCCKVSYRRPFKKYLSLMCAVTASSPHLPVYVLLPKLSGLCVHMFCSLSRTYIHISFENLYCLIKSAILVGCSWHFSVFVDKRNNTI